MTASLRPPAGGRRLTPPPEAPAPRVQGRRVVDVAAVALGVGLGASAALPVASVHASSLRAPGGVALLSGDVTAMAGTYLVLVMVLLAGRVPAVERVLGQDRLIRWHRWLSPTPLALLSAHAVLTTLGYAEAGRLGIWAEGGSLVTTMAWILAAVVSWVMLLAIAGVSVRAVRRRVNYDTWWVIHLYTYLALALSVPHQIVDGTDFVGHPVARAGWILLWLATAGVVVCYRIGLPVARSCYHGLRVREVRPEGPGVYSLVVGGRHLDRLPVAGGQYLSWRFLTRGMWWHAHPFSLSAMPAPPYLRVTIKVTGDTTSAIARLRPGTRIAVEGPYGAFTSAARSTNRVALVGAGVGITPLRALLEDLPDGVDVVVVQRASTRDGLVHHDEVAELVADRGGRLVDLVGPRHRHRLDDPRQLRRLIPDLVTRDLYVCGPEPFADGLARAARQLGVPRTAIHRETFAF